MEYDLAFEGGGAKGAAFVGALEELEARGHTARRFVGTSAGAITAVLVAAGYRATELRDVLVEQLPDGRPRMAAFMDPPPRLAADELEKTFLADVLRRVDVPILPDGLEHRVDRALLEQMLEITIVRQMVSLLDRGGLYAGTAFLEWIREKLERKRAGWGEAPFRRFASESGRDVTLIASDTTGQEMLVLNTRTAPECPVSWAVRMSMSIPFVWQEVEWRPEWGLYRGRDLTGHVIVDGGLLSNFPIALLTADLADVVTLMGETDPTSVPNIGFLIDEDLAVEGEPPRRGTLGLLGELAHSRPALRIQRLIDTIMNARDRMVIERCMMNEEICRLPAQGYGVAEFDMTGPRLHALIAAGRRATATYLDTRERRERASGRAAPQDL